MKVREGFIIRQVGGQPRVVAVGPSSQLFTGMVKLNATSEFLFEKLQKDTSEDELVKAVVEKYEVDEETARKDVQSFIETLVKPGIIEE